MPFVSSSIYHKAIRLALDEGLSPDLVDAHKTTLEVARGDKYLPLSLLLEVYEYANQHLEPGFGVRQGRQLHSTDYGTLGLSWKTCWRAKDVLDWTARYMILVTDYGSARMEERDGRTSIILDRDAGRKGLDVANEATFVMLAGIIREVTGKDIHPVNVNYKHANPDPKPFTDHFHCPVQFGHKENALQFNTIDIDIPTIKADQSIHQFLVDRMDEETTDIYTRTDQLLANIRTMVQEALPGGLPSIIQVAQNLNMSARTLKRKLAAKHLTFRELVQTIQQDVSIALINDSTCTMAEIAFQTGFSEQSAFNRAFKRWTGKTPVEYRKNG